MTVKSDSKFEKKQLTCHLQNEMRNLANFYHSTQKSQNWDFDGIFLSKEENECAERSYKIVTVNHFCVSHKNRWKHNQHFKL